MATSIISRAPNIGGNLGPAAQMANIFAGLSQSNLDKVFRTLWHERDINLERQKIAAEKEIARKNRDASWGLAGMQMAGDIGGSALGSWMLGDALSKMPKQAPTGTETAAKAVQGGGTASKVGQGVGMGIGSLFGPVGMAVGPAVGGAAGGLVDSFLGKAPTANTQSTELLNRAAVGKVLMDAFTQAMMR